MELQTDVTRSGGQFACSTHAPTNTINTHEPSLGGNTSSAVLRDVGCLGTGLIFVGRVSDWNRTDL